MPREPYVVTKVRLEYMPHSGPRVAPIVPFEVADVLEKNVSRPPPLEDYGEHLEHGSVQVIESSLGPRFGERLTRKPGAKEVMLWDKKVVFIARIRPEAKTILVFFVQKFTDIPMHLHKASVLV